MNPDDILQQLEALGTAQNRKVYGRHGVQPPLFGVSYSALGKLKKSIKTDHGLAVSLWESGNHDARILACMIADPAATTVKELNGWSKDLNDYVLTDALAGLAAKSPHAEGRLKQWSKSRNEWIGSAAWCILSAMAVGDNDYPDEFFAPWISVIEHRIQNAPNRTRHVMNNALIAIGVRSDALAEQATAAAGRMGTVTVDHGETSCKTPDAAAYIQKTRAHYAAKGKPNRRKRC